MAADLKTNLFLTRLVLTATRKYKNLKRKRTIAFPVRMANVKIVKNLSLVMLDCTFTMYSARVYSISQW